MTETPSFTPEQGRALAEAIANACIKAGLIRPDALLTGPHLLQFVDDLATAHLATEQALKDSRELVDLLLSGTENDRLNELREAHEINKALEAEIQTVETHT